MAVKQGLLALIDERPRYGYELKTEFEAATGGVWTINVGQVYTTLDRLERDGLVTITVVDDDGDTTETGPQKRYELTAAGREELAAWWRSVPDGQPARDELLIKVLLAIQHSRATALEVITLHRTALTARLQLRRQQQRQALAGTGAGIETSNANGSHGDGSNTNGSDGEGINGDGGSHQDRSESNALADVLAFDALIVRAEANLRWLEQCEARVLRAPDRAFAFPEEVNR